MSVLLSRRTRVVFCRLTAAAAFLFASAVYGPVFCEDWPMFLKDPAHTSSAAKFPQTPLSPKWAYKTDGPLYSSPVVSGGRVYIGSYDRKLHALDASKGSALWTFKTEGEVLSTPAVSAGKVYFGSKDGYVYALDAVAGSLSWKFKTMDAVLTSPVAAEGLVFIASNDTYIYALDQNSGKLIWKAKLADYKYSGVYSSPAYSNGSVYIAGKNAMIYSFSAKSGGRNWFKRVGSSIYSSPVISDDVLYFSSFDRYIYAVGATDGKHIWKKRLDAVPYASPVAIGDGVYQGLKDGYFKGFNKKTGEKKNTFKFPGQINAGIVASLDGKAFVSSDDGNVYLLNTLTGDILWKHKAGAGIHSTPALANNTLYIGSKDGVLYALTSGGK
ncbi:MAG: PQQ-binding-like beta-propeller repeat protein [Deltaproteobacteria bacterium]|nr:PQQ-binding-like beta-propeller repeat protein [Deltaproteobacteria bacterium]